MVWQAPERNEWDVAIRQSLEAVASAGLDAFSLADPPTVKGTLEPAGFADVAFTDVHELVYYGTSGRKKFTATPRRSSS